MPRDRLAITSRPRSEACRATARVLEDMNFECSFLYPERKNQPENLSDTIAGQFGLEWSTYRVVVDDVEFIFSRYHGEEDYRLDEISHRTNPKLWTRADIAAPKKEASDIFFEFDLSEEKKDALSLPADLEIDCDAEKGLVVFDFAADEAATAWARIADTVFISLTKNRSLKSILFEGVEL